MQSPSCFREFAFLACCIIYEMTDANSFEDFEIKVTSNGKRSHSLSLLKDGDNKWLPYKKGTCSE